MSIDEIATSIKNGRRDHKPILIAIEGFGGAGKTTFAERLKTALGNSYVINIDDFIVKEKLTKRSWDNGAFDLKRLEQQVLSPASRSRQVKYQSLIWDTNELSPPKEVAPVDFLIVEGITSYHPSIAHYYDYKIWVDTPMEVAKQRGHARDGSNENAANWDLWTQNDLDYQQKYHPEQAADYIFDNKQDLDPALV